jgi:hypothetical protein
MLYSSKTFNDIIQEINHEILTDKCVLGVFECKKRFSERGSSNKRVCEGLWCKQFALLVYFSIMNIYNETNYIHNLT